MAIRKPVKTVEMIEKEEAAPKEDLREAPKALKAERAANGFWMWTYQPAGGEVPNALKGFFTSINQANAAYQRFLLRAK